MRRLKTKGEGGRMKVKIQDAEFEEKKRKEAVPEK